VRPSHNLEHNSIACVREEVAPNTFRTLSGRETLQQQEIHLIRVPTVDAVLQENWFLDQIHAVCSQRKKMGLCPIASLHPVMPIADEASPLSLPRSRAS
jgi:hypothetical protein